MKLKNVASLCSRSKIFRLYDKVDRNGVTTQWLGDGSAAYPLYGLPYLDERSLYRMFDVPEKTQDKIYFDQGIMPEEINVDDASAGDMLAEDMGITVSYGGKILLPLRYSGGILYIQSKYLSPLEDQADFLQLYVRRTESGGRYIAAKAGMMIAGIIYPFNALKEGFVEKLEELTALTRREMDKCRQGYPVTDEAEGWQENLLEGRNEEET